MDEVLLETRRFTVRRLEYNVPGQGLVRRELVAHPGAVTILPLLDPQTVIMIRNYRFAVGAELLELPAGTLEPPEPPAECAARELEEETGYRAAHFERLCEFYTTPGFTNERMHVFVATGLTPTKQRLEATEQIRVEIVPLRDALEATTDGRIVDAKTIASLQIYHYRFGRKQ
ncbi:MAG: NUDIX hydrolase [Planctomycetes bacterium]|nr:NUDIX hydrolase [Planctomycetota bacterium]